MHAGSYRKENHRLFFGEMSELANMKLSKSVAFSLEPEPCEPSPFLIQIPRQAAGII
jgi:hypothetical protein